MAAAMETEQPGFEIFETAENKENVAPEEKAKLEPYYVERYSWSHLKKLLMDTRKYHGCLMAKAPHDFTFVKKRDPEGPHSDRVYFLGKDGGEDCPATKESRVEGDLRTRLTLAPTNTTFTWEDGLPLGLLWS